MSAPMVIAGRAGAREVGMSTSRTRDSREITKIISGPAEDVFAIEESIFNDGAVSVQTVQQPGSCLATLTARFPFSITGIPGGGGENGLITDEVTTQYSSVPIPIKQHGYFSELSIDGIITIDNAIDARADFPAGGDGLDANTKWEEYYLLRRMGVNEFEAKLPVVRYTLRCTPQYTGLLDTNNVGTVYTQAQMANRISNADFFTLAEPQGVYNANAYGYFYTGWRLEAVLSFDVDGNGVLEEVYTWGQYAKQLHTFAFATP
jgi:hypothetical protein